MEPKRPMKPLYWSRIQIKAGSAEESRCLWAQLDESPIDPSEFEELFCKSARAEKKQPLAESYAKKSRAKQVTKLLDGKRSQAVGILMSSLHLDIKDIQRAVLEMDTSQVDLETLQALYENRAQKEELLSIRSHVSNNASADAKPLDKPEQFLLELSQIPSFSERVFCMTFQSAFSEGMSGVRRKLDLMQRVCTSLRVGAGVQRVLGLVLALGNHMNGGNRTRGQADGFSLDILPKLRDVKSSDNHTSLVCYLTSVYLRCFDNDAGTERSVFPLPEPPDLLQTSHMAFEDFSKELRRLRRDLKACESEMERVCNTSAPENLQPFKSKMQDFLTSSKIRQETEERFLEETHKNFLDTAEFFCMRPRNGEKEVTPTQLLGLWAEFAADFKESWKKESKRIVAERLREAQKQYTVRTAPPGQVTLTAKKADGLKARLRLKATSSMSEA